MDGVTVSYGGHPIVRVVNQHLVDVHHGELPGQADMLRSMLGHLLKDNGVVLVYRDLEAEKQGAASWA